MRYNAWTLMAAAAVVTACSSAAEAPAYYPARQADLVSATARVFGRLNLPLSEVSEAVVRSREVWASDVWTDEQIQERIKCPKAISKVQSDSMLVTLAARVMEDTRAALPTGQPTGVRTRLNDTSLHLSTDARSIVNGKTTTCNMTVAFSQQVLDDIGQQVGIPASRTPH